MLDLDPIKNRLTHAAQGPQPNWGILLRAIENDAVALVAEVERLRAVLAEVRCVDVMLAGGDLDA